MGPLGLIRRIAGPRLSQGAACLADQRQAARAVLVRQ
jgi:hypothetical protein